MASASLAPFRSRDFSLIWVGALVSNIGTWMETVAIGYYVADTTGQASWSAIVAAAAFVPGAIVGPIGSAMADRLRRRRVLMTTNAISAVIASIVAIWVGSGHATPLGLAVLGFVAGTVFAFGFPSFQTSLPDLVPREHLVAAVGLSNAQWNLGRVIGPALAALAIAIGGIELALWCNAVSYVAVIIAVSVVRLPRGGGERRPIFAALGDGLSFVRSTPAMRRMIVVMIVVIGFGSPFIAFVPQMATNVFNGDSTATSILVTAQGLGAVTAAFTLGSITNRFGSWRVMVGAALSFAGALGAVRSRAPAVDRRCDAVAGGSQLRLRVHLDGRHRPTPRSRRDARARACREQLRPGSAVSAGHRDPGGDCRCFVAARGDHRLRGGPGHCPGPAPPARSASAAGRSGARSATRPTVSDDEAKWLTS